MNQITALSQRLRDSLIRRLVRGKHVPLDPVRELELSRERPIVYILPRYSRTDLLALQLTCESLELPDPLEPLQLGDETLSRYIFIQDDNVATTPQALKTFSQLAKLHRHDPTLDVQLVPVKLFWSRYPGRESLESISKSLQPQPPTLWVKAFQILFKGRQNLVRLSPAVSLRYMADQRGSDQQMAQKLARVARIHFSRMHHIATGPKLPDRRRLFEQLLSSKALRCAIEEDAKTEQITEEAAKQKALRYLDEIAADFSYPVIRNFDHFLSWVWNKIYAGIEVNHAERVRQLAQEGHEIVFVPCHRSHMDYLLLSYILYHQGMVPPHIAAGVNLNFWPAGPLFRRSGAFFIRRSFKGNRLYSTVFREYLGQLFAKGYSVEYFTEGGRTRTGRLLAPKTGMLAMTVETMLRGLDRPVALVPIYFGYEHVMEVATYFKELKGKKKEKESFLHLFAIVRKLRNFGRGYVNFGEPLLLNQYLTQVQPDWRDAINPIEPQKPEWLAPVVNQVANDIMVRINDAAAVSALALSGTILLSAEQYALSRRQLTNQLSLYRSLLVENPYSSRVTLPEGDAKQLLEHALSLHKFEVSKDSLGEIIRLDERQQVLMTFYRNNIIHLFVIPALVACALLRTSGHKKRIVTMVETLYPMLQDELFMHYENDTIADIVSQTLAFFTRQGLCEAHGDDAFHPVSAQRSKLVLLAAMVHETIVKYAMIAGLMVARPNLEREELESVCYTASQRLVALHQIASPEFNDKRLFTKLLNNFENLGYSQSEPATELLALLLPLLPAELRTHVAELYADEQPE
jgi:glycerol-3-phosphate O-acyltransferase